MKIKINKNDKEMTADYIREGKVYLLRYNALKFLFDKFGGDMYVFVNTNNRKRKAPNQNIEKKLDNLNLEYRTEPAEKKVKKMIDLSWAFKPKEKDMSEYVVLVKLTDLSNLENLYDDLLQYYDYGVGCGAKKPLDAVFNIIKHDASKALFSKEYFQLTMYDSIIFYRMRVDAPYEDLLNYIENLA